MTQPKSIEPAEHKHAFSGAWAPGGAWAAHCTFSVGVFEEAGACPGWPRPVAGRLVPLPSVMVAAVEYRPPPESRGREPPGRCVSSPGRWPGLR
jgi:hypothetical protein